MSSIEAVQNTEPVVERLENLKRLILKSLEGKFLTFEIYFVIFTLLLSLSITPEQAQGGTVADSCDTNELEVYMGEELLPPEITVKQIQEIYQLVCTYAGGGDKFNEGEVKLAIEDLEALPTQSGDGDVASSVVYETQKGNKGVVAVAAKAYGLPHNPPVWAMVLAHEFDHLFGGTHGADWALIDKLRIHFIEKGVYTGVWDTYWWEAIMQYASAHHCDVPVENDKALAAEVCNKAAAILDEQ